MLLCLGKKLLPNYLSGLKQFFVMLSCCAGQKLLGREVSQVRK